MRVVAEHNAPLSAYHHYRMHCSLHIRGDADVVEPFAPVTCNEERVPICQLYTDYATRTWLTPCLITDLPLSFAYPTSHPVEDHDDAKSYSDPRSTQNLPRARA